MKEDKKKLQSQGTSTVWNGVEEGQPITEAGVDRKSKKMIRKKKIENEEESIWLGSLISIKKVEDQCICLVFKIFLLHNLLCWKGLSAVKEQSHRNGDRKARKMRGSDQKQRSPGILILFPLPLQNAPGLILIPNYITVS